MLATDRPTVSERLGDQRVVSGELAENLFALPGVGGLEGAGSTPRLANAAAVSHTWPLAVQYLVTWVPRFSESTIWATSPMCCSGPGSGSRVPSPQAMWSTSRTAAAARNGVGPVLVDAVTRRPGTVRVDSCWFPLAPAASAAAAVAMASRYRAVD